jgi:DNA replication and repair protein RecF
MKLSSLSLRNFRNIVHADIQLDSHLNFFIGLNGQGKTSILEAVNYLSTLRSFRGAKTDDVINYSSGESFVTSQIRDENWNTDLKVIFKKFGDKSSKQALINEKAYKSSTQYLSQRFGQAQLGFHVVVFNPADHDLVRGEPSIRRNYLDRVVSAEDFDHFKTVSRYQRVLLQRNALLKSPETPNRDILRDFSIQLVQLGAKIALKRLSWLERVSPRLPQILDSFAPTSLHLRPIYASNWIPEIKNLSYKNNNLNFVHFTGQDALPSLEILEQSFWKQLVLMEPAELKARSSLVGPHRDDWIFFQGDRILKGHGSQGEVRSALMALKLCEIELFQKSSGLNPILLLDDFSSELDQDRRVFLLRFLTETDLQVLVTTTEDSLKVGKRFWVSDGKAHDDIGLISGLTERLLSR